MGRKTDDYSALSLGADCWRKYKYRYVDRLEPKDAVDPPYLHAGSVGHKVFHFWYTEEWNLEAGIELAREEWGDYKPKGKHSYLTLGHFELVLEEYFEDRSKNPTALEAEGDIGSRLGAEEAVEFVWPHSKTGEELKLGGIPDLPTAFASQNYIVDNKFTTGWLNQQWASNFQLGHQFRIYCAMLKHTTGVEYDGAYVNGIYMGEPPKSGWKKVKSVQNKLLGPFRYTQEHLDETWEWVKAHQTHRELCEASGTWPQNEKSCGYYGGCDYLDLCERSPKVRPAIKQMLYRIKEEPDGSLVSGADAGS